MDREPAQRVPPVGYWRTHGYSPAIVFEALVRLFYYALGGSHRLLQRLSTFYPRSTRHGISVGIDPAYDNFSTFFTAAIEGRES